MSIDWFRFAVYAAILVGTAAFWLAVGWLVRAVLP